MNTFYGIIAAFALVFLIFQGRSLVPRIISFLLPGNRRLYFEDDLSNPGDGTRRERMRPIVEKIESLGFSKLGVMVEKQPLWAKGSRELSLASAAQKTFASVGLRHNQPSYFFYTPYTGGQIVITAYNAFRHLQRDDFMTTVVYSEDPGETLEVHKKQVEEFINKGFNPYKEYTRDSLVQATVQYYHSSYPRQQLRTAGIFNLLFFLLIVFVFALLVKGAFS
jgi:hypothetical protein